MTHRIGRAAVLAAALLAITAGGAFAHEERDVGDYSFEVGFIDEPVFTGQKSGLELIVSSGDEPVEGLEETLEAEVTFGSQTRDLEISPRFGEPGAYESVFFPTAAGPYTFRIYGDVEGATIDESFTSSPDGFGEVEELSGGQFPVQFPSDGRRGGRCRGRRGRGDAGHDRARPGGDRAARGPRGPWPDRGAPQQLMRVPRWWRLAGVAAVLALLAIPAVPGTGSRVLAHAQLVASSPASGAVLPESPDELRLVFSEPIEGEATSLDLAGLDGTSILERAGTVDPEDPVRARRRLSEPRRRDLHAHLAQPFGGRRPCRGWIPLLRRR